ncbi:EAL domain-containing protein [Sporolactobacillus shoreicorticis]|uniref:Bifunctional diguanylate cyclase/phosphodiesterase n=1 Tax=Sporolactobacillus shoreicorticis TaxID=1923877 RepID=A0ABW5S602_9BACL|nr:EAL domain-containing protein [Sporolactobacillus shoreicorticis]MCO7128070.1 EAL domain-containing protein [Sporolactobacillus shoreicorticis]
MSEQFNRDQWLEAVKKQITDQSIADPSVLGRIRLAQIRKFDLQLLKWMHPYLINRCSKITDQMSQHTLDLYKMQSMVPSQETKEYLIKMYEEQTRFLFNGVLDGRFLTFCDQSALFFLNKKLSIANQVALFSLYHRALIETVEHEVNYPEQALLLSESLDKLLSLEQQLILERYQQLKHARELEKEEVIRFRAYHDALTGLPNNLVAEELVDDLVNRYNQTRRSFSILKINIDRLKMINEIFGRQIGNELLIALSGRMKEALERFNAELYRISSDEFMIICKDCLNKRGLVQVIEMLLRTTEQPYHIDGKEIYATFSIGISQFPYDGSSSVQIMASAEAALREAKKSSRKSFFFYNNELHQKLLMRLNTENELQSALYNHQFVLYYQPQVDACSGTLIGVEALVRWKHPERGIVPPSGFISVAEETGMIRDIGWWVLDEACRQMKKWQERGPLKVPISVNLSFNQFHDDSLVKRVCFALEASGLQPEYLELEITESTMAEDLERSIRRLKEIRALGVGVSLDDFGTGYSSLSYLKSLPINQLKIDRSFVLDIAQSNQDQAIVTAIVSMAEHLWIDVIVEGIETKEQLRAIESCRCRAIQGYYYSRPLAENDFSDKYLA